jgi:hypothetical protein
LIMTTALSATNAVDATAETQAYYAAEAGMQATLTVLRGNVAPNPLFDTSSPTAAANKISFRKAVTLAFSNASGDAATTSNTARLSRWLNYNALTASSRVEISSPYSTLTGMAYTTVVDDPDNTAAQTYSTLGSFGSDAPSPSSISYQFGSGSTRVTVWYAPQASTAISSGGTTLGTFHLTQLNGSPDLCSIDPVKCKFKITIRQVSSSGTIDVPVNCTLTYASNAVTVTFSPPSPTSNNISGTIYAHTDSVSVPSSGSNISIPVTITPPEPPRLRVTVTGYGPRGAKKQMHMLLSRYAFDYTPSAAITLRGADSGLSPASVSIGNSSQYNYTGNDHAGGANLPAFLVTNAIDYASVTALVPLGSTQVTGNPALQQSSSSTLSTFLQTADEARKLVDSLRIEAQDAHRYFTTATPPTDFGASTPNGLLTFVEGDVDLPPGGGAGTLVVTGTLTMRGSADFKGVILVLGGGQLLRDGGGNGNTLGSIIVASFGASGGFLAPTFNSNGGGTADVSFDSDWTRRALQNAGPRVLGVSEY